MVDKGIETHREVARFLLNTSQGNLERTCLKTGATSYVWNKMGGIYLKIFLQDNHILNLVKGIMSRAEVFIHIGPILGWGQVYTRKWNSIFRCSFKIWKLQQKEHSLYKVRIQL